METNEHKIIFDHAARGMFSFCGYELSRNEADIAAERVKKEGGTT
jgi:hypothetical protein|nr:MAG TPA: hypothetical protein [Caudoviricetes sp.]